MIQSIQTIPTDRQPEEWRPVVGFEGRYEVLNLGRVRSIRILNPGLCKQSGRRMVGLCRGSGRVKNANIAPLVLAAFSGPRPDGLVCCHGDGDRTNDRLENLRWDTLSANVDDARRHGTLGRGPRPQGENHHKAVLTSDDVRCIRAEPDFHGVLAMLARSFGVTAAHIQRIRLRENWAT